MRVVLDGPVGTGKSATLLQILDASLPTATTGQRVIIYVPRLASWTAGYYPYRVSERTPSDYDQPDLALALLEATVALNPALLPFAGLLAEARKSPSHAVPAMEQMLKDFARLSQPKLLLLDNLNALYAPTGYRTVDSAPLDIDRLSVPRALRDLVSNPAVSLIGANSYSNPALAASALQRDSQAQAGPEMRTSSVPFVPSARWETLSYFSPTEVQTILEYYHALGHVFAPLTRTYAHKIHFLSGGSGTKILSALNYDSVYKK